jgi:predicted aldo/keto reductase-like oxidoreductase
MRLPMRGKSVDREKALPLFERAYALGVNYFDTGKFYCDGDSERTVGEALKGMDRSRVYLSTKYAMQRHTADDLRARFEQSLTELDQDYVDFYHLWGISWKSFTEELSIPGGPVEAFVRLKEQGAIRHLSFSFHSAPEDIPKLVDTGLFDTMLCQYNLLDRKNEGGIKYAATKGLGVAIMGPVGGGRLGSPSEVVSRLLPDQSRVSSPELALRFVLSNPSVSMALSGMSTLEQVEQNVTTVTRDEHLATPELEAINRSALENQRMMDLYCTGCKYCEPCPADVNISEVFRAMNYHEVWDLKEYARGQYAAIGSNQWLPGKRADACTECGDCETKCPQRIAIREQLKQCHRVLGP